MNKPALTTRRTFLRHSLAATAFPYVITSQALGSRDVPPASERITLAHIGVGIQGSGLLKGFLYLDGCQSVAVCDAFAGHRKNAAAIVDQFQSERAGKTYRGCAQYEDFRRILERDDIDAVVIATPDHWHVPIALAAAKAGKDMYVEKPLGISIEENKQLRETIRRYGNVFQYGTQQRCFSSHCAFTCELVRNGRIGTLKEIHVEAPAGQEGGSTTIIPVPKDLNYDLWLGPAPVSPYTADRCTNHGSWFVYDNALGFIAGWGAHPLDIMHWGYPHIPIEYQGTGTIPTEGLFDTITTWNVRGRFNSGAVFTFKHGPADKTLFVGEDGWVWASRHNTDAHPKSLLKDIIQADEIHLLQSHNHYQNFIDAVKTRIKPASPVKSAVQSDFISHLSNIAIRTGSKVTWDPQKETIVGNEPAARMMRRASRVTWQA
ncbi:MAG: Gfo/Idh/MocA family protein [Planctomycetota bacterium]